MGKFETITYEERGAVATITLNRPDVFNAFNQTMQDELAKTWRSLRTNDAINCIVLTAAGDKAFCTGIDRAEVPNDEAGDGASKPNKYLTGTSNPFMMDDPGEKLDPKQCDLWKPVVAAVNGMACGGAFYLLSEADIIICSESATFFDPHVTYGMAAVFEPVLMLQKMPFSEVMRMSLMGSYERISAKRALEIGLVTEVVPSDKLQETAHSIAKDIASQPPLAVQATLRSVWMGHELSRSQAVSVSPSLLGAGNTRESLAEGQKVFASKKRIEPRIR